MNRPTSRQRRLAKAAAVPVALLASALVVWQGSYAAFNATTNSPNNQWSTGKVELKNDTVSPEAAVGAAKFSLTGNNRIKIGSSGSACIVVHNTGDYDGPVKLYSANASSNALAGALKLTVDAAAGQFTNCTGFPGSPTNLVTNVALSGMPTNFAGGYDGATVNSNAYRTYRVSWSLPTTGTTAGDNALQNLNASVDFVWETQV
jgi:hypothetical protein